MIALGFKGNDISDPGVISIAQDIAGNKLGGMVLFGYNIQNP